jgi:protein-S-isoprenylcysteine O-methyltransferase Ste14
MPLLLKISILLSFLFLLSEIILVLTKHSAKKTTFRKRDNGSLLFFWIIIGSSLTAGFNLAKFHDWKFVNILTGSAGISLILAGLVIRWIAILQLKKAFTVNVAVSVNHVLKTDGLYRFVMHPGYLGLLLIMTGEALTMNTIISFIVVFVPICLTILYRIYTEEKLLEEFFGETYRNYKHNTSRIIPFIY